MDLNETSMPDYFAHESSYIDDGAVIGPGTKIWHFSHVSAGAEIGERCSLGQNVFVARNVRVGNGVKINDFTNTDPLGRLSTFLTSGMAYSGSRSLIMDFSGWNGGIGSNNFVYGTFKT